MAKGSSLSTSIPFHLLLAILGVYVFRFGYAYGFSDQDEFLPYLMHLLDPSLFTNDWFVNTQLSSFSIRAYFVYLLYVPAALFSPAVAVGVLYFMCWFAIASGLYMLALQLTQNSIASILSVAIALVMTPFWTLGGNDLVHGMMVPSMLGWSLGLWALVFFFKGRFPFTAFLLGIATLFQALVGLQLGLVLGLLMIAQRIAKRGRTIKEIVIFGLVYLLCASPALIPLFVQQLGNTAATLMPHSIAGQYFYIMAEFRAPHHYLFHSFNEQRMLQFWILGGLGVVSLFFHTRKSKQLPTFEIISILVIICALCLVAYTGTERFHVLPILKLQLFKLTVLAKVLFVISICMAAATALPSRFQSLIERWFFNAPGKFMGVCIIAYMLLVFLQLDRYQAKVYPLSASTDSKAAVYTWARTNTEETAIFATPPSWSGFRTTAARNIVINHKAYAYNDNDVHEWFARLNDMAPTDISGRTDDTLISTLDDAYEHASLSKLESNISRYNIDYLVRSTPLDAYPLLYSTDEWYVYGTDLTGPNAP